MQRAATETVAELKNASRAGIEYTIMNNKVRASTSFVCIDSLHYHSTNNFQRFYFAKAKNLG